MCGPRSETPTHIYGFFSLKKRLIRKFFFENFRKSRSIGCVDFYRDFFCDVWKLFPETATSTGSCELRIWLLPHHLSFEWNLNYLQSKCSLLSFWLPVTKPNMKCCSIAFQLEVISNRTFSSCSCKINFCSINSDLDILSSEAFILLSHSS